MKLFSAVALSASLLTSGFIQAQPLASDLEEKCIHIEQSIDHINTPDQSDECFDQLQLAYANANEAEMSIHFQQYVTAKNYLIQVLSELQASIILSCKHLDDIAQVHKQTVDLINALPENG